jgi:hypothetical protein
MGCTHRENGVLCGAEVCGVKEMLGVKSEEEEQGVGKIVAQSL